MKINKITQNFILITTTATLLVGGNVKKAQGAVLGAVDNHLLYQELSLFNQNQKLGSVSFFYENQPFEGTFTEEFLFMSDSLSISENQDLHLVPENIQITLLGNSLKLGIGSGSGSGTSSFIQEYFWTPLDFTAPEKQLGPSAVWISGPEPDVFLRNSWFFGNTRGDYFQLNHQKSWQFVDLSGNPTPQSISGTWELSSPSKAIPEPLTILGTITALSIGSFLKRKYAKPT